MRDPLMVSFLAEAEALGMEDDPAVDVRVILEGGIGRTGLVDVDVKTGHVRLWRRLDDGSTAEAPQHFHVDHIVMAHYDTGA